MDPIIVEYENDLDKICSQLDFIESLKKFNSANTPLGNSCCEQEFIAEALIIHEGTKRVHGNLTLVAGTLVLYTCGRFEAMTRTLFEDLCQRLVSKAGEFSRLPKKMRTNLPIFTAKVISEPRRYGHAENGVRSFVSTLASNLEPNARISKVNHECLSITETNMRADALSDLFSRIGAEKIWTGISEQAAIKSYFEESDTSKVEAKARKKLNDLMDIRNRIAHPSGEFEWPSTHTIKDYVKFLRLIAKAMGEIMSLYEVTLCTAETAQ
ncbi:HEPN domain-containing protein [Pseudomonas sp. FEMGT703P]|uniref:HEPN domain-containing protein n=1 Tax=Pseudomonas sp. FEMGT703P TaxID=2080764 RepID=UPI00259D15E9|nr:HEPN domain-containing protein [Pseudomonas sp. FEMGT703P]